MNIQLILRLRRKPLHDITHATQVMLTRCIGMNITTKKNKDLKVRIQPLEYKRKCPDMLRAWLIIHLLATFEECHKFLHDVVRTHKYHGR